MTQTYSGICWGGPAHGKLVTQPHNVFRVTMRGQPEYDRPRDPPDDRTRWQKLVHAVTGVCPAPVARVTRLPMIDVEYTHERVADYDRRELYHVWVPRGGLEGLDEREMLLICAYMRGRTDCVRQLIPLEVMESMGRRRL